MVGQTNPSPKKKLFVSAWFQSPRNISRRIRFSGEMWLNRLDDRPQSNRQTIASEYFLSGDRSSCDGRFFLKVNRCKLFLRDNDRKFSYQVDSFRKHVAYATAFVKYAGECRRAVTTRPIVAAARGMLCLADTTISVHLPGADREDAVKVLRG
jgi:hypothetical protein